MFDTKTEKFQEWQVPGRFFAPYDAMADKNGNVWTAGMNADRVLRLDPKSGQFVEYPLPPLHQCPPRLRRQQHADADVLDRQQPRRRADQARAAGVAGTDSSP